MMAVEEIKTAIESLPSEDYAQLRQWFLEKEQSIWDAQLERDSLSGKLDFLIDEAILEKEKGRLKEI